MTEQRPPRVFVSYSHDTVEHQGAVVPWLRAANHGLLYVYERPPAARALPDMTAAAGTVFTTGRAK